MGAIKDILAERNESALLADGFEKALVGVTTGFVNGHQNALAVYDRDKCIKILMKRDGMSYDDAQEFLEFNTEGAWMGPNTPVFAEFPKKH